MLVYMKFMMHYLNELSLFGRNSIYQTKQKLERKTKKKKKTCEKVKTECVNVHYCILITVRLPNNLFDLLNNDHLIIR